MKNINDNSEKNTKIFEALKISNFAGMNLKPNEQVKHCIDNTDSGYYQPNWAVTNHARIWSLSHKHWLLPRNQSGYWRVANKYVHRIVDHYFMSEEEKNTKRILEEHNQNCSEADMWSGDVHHIKTGSKMDSSMMSKEERITECSKVNHKENLVFQIRADHKDAHRIMKGEKTVGEEKGTEQFDDFTSIIRNSNPAANYSYDEQGKKLLHMKLKLQGTTPEEDAELDKKFPHRFLC